MNEQTEATTSATTTTAVETTQREPETVPEAVVAGAAAAGINRQAMWYVLAFAIVAVIGAGLWFFLEKDGRVNTTVFSGMTDFLKRSQAAAVVNGTEISVLDFESTLRQLSANTQQQGLDPADPAVIADLREQAIESLINTELLRQAAVAADVTVTDEEVDTRYDQIVQSVGSVEALTARMAELGVSEEMLRRDIRNDILIQAHIESAVDTNAATVSDDEITTFYNQVAGSNPEAVPPLDEVRGQIEESLLFQKQQEIVGTYVDGLRSEASVEVTLE